MDIVELNRGAPRAPRAKGTQKVKAQKNNIDARRDLWKMSKVNGSQEKKISGKNYEILVHTLQPRFQKVLDLFEDNFKKNRELGAQFTVYWRKSLYFSNSSERTVFL